MLYVFLVNTGEMLTLDMALTMESVQQLHEAVSEEYHIPQDKQVLLISGGQSLDPQMRVCSYSAGTDTNPIFLFSKGTIESAQPPVTASMAQAREDNLRLQVEGLKNLPPSYSAVVARTQLALQFHEVAKEKLRVCEGLIHNQHLQQQGWMAVIANLDDITSAFQQRAKLFQQNMAEFLSERPGLLDRLEEFGDILQLLEKTPLLPCLLGGEAGPSTPTSPASAPTPTPTLMMWISRQDERSTLQQMASQCSKVLQQFNQPILDGLSAEITACLEAVSNAGMKEIKGLGERLFGLEQLLLQARKLLTEQAEMAQGLVQNQTRASNLKEPSVLPDLCLSHQQQLTVMYKKHLQLADMSRRCEIAQEELCQNLHVRLRWVMYVEQQISSSHGKMVVYHENLKRLRKRLEIIRQVCITPRLYASAVLEVCRRRKYNSRYHEWAGCISQTSVMEHEQEIKRRKDFASLMHNHFLNALFPGFYETPPAFATTPPGDYDNLLPNILESDIQLLRTKVPELAEIMELPMEDHFVFDTSHQTKQLKPRPISMEIQTQTDMRSQDASTSVEGGSVDLTQASVPDEDRGATPPSLQSLEDQPQQGDSVDSQDSQSPDRNTPTQGDTPTQDGALMERQLSQPGQLSLGLLQGPMAGKEDVAPSFESVYRDAPFSSLLPEVDSEFHSAIGSPMDDSLVQKAKMDQILPALAPVEENQTLRQKLQEQQGILQELEQEKSALERQLSDSETRIGTLQDSVSSRSQRLEESHHRAQSLQGLVQTHVGELRAKCSDIKKSVSAARQQMQQEMQDSLVRIADQSILFLEDVRRGQTEAVQQAIQGLQSQLEQERTEFRQQQSEQTASLDLAKQRVKELEEELREKRDSSELLKSKYEQGLEEVRSKLEEEEKQMIASVKMELEMEITDLESTIQERELEIKELSVKWAQKLGEAEARLGAEKARELEELTREMEGKHREQLHQVKKDLQSVHLEEVASLKEASVLQMEAALERERALLKEEHRKEIERLRKEGEDKVEIVKSEMQSASQMRLEEEQRQGKVVVEEKHRDLEQRTKEIEHLQQLMKDEMSKHEEYVTSQLEAQRQDLLASHERSIQELRKQHEEQLQACKDDLNADLEKRILEERTQHRELLEKREEELLCQHKEEMRIHKETHCAEQERRQTELQEQFEAKLKEVCDSKNDDLIAMQACNEEIGNLKAVIGQLRAELQEKEEALEELRQERLEGEKQEESRLQLSQTDALQALDTKSKDLTVSAPSVMTTSASAGQQQVAFNKAVARVAATKDKRIAQLEEREKELVDEQLNIKDTIEKLLLDKAELDFELRSALTKAQEGQWQAEQEQSRLEGCVRDLTARLRGETPASLGEGASQGASQGAEGSQEGGSPAELIVSTQSDGLTEVTETKDQLKALLQSKEQECHTLKKQLMHLRTSSPGGRVERVAISDISLGDLVFIIFQEGQENYMVYSIEPTLYFLHTESLAALGLRTKAQTTHKFNWTIARITDKEYCQAKKAQNRFKVPVGSKFYRVKAIRYDPKVEHVSRK